MFAYIYFSKKKNIYIISVISCHVLQKLSVRWKGQHLKRINSCLSTYLNLWLTLVSWHICSLIDSLATLTFGRSDYIILWLPSYEFVTTTCSLGSKPSTYPYPFYNFSLNSCFSHCCKFIFFGNTISFLESCFIILFFPLPWPLP